MSARLATAAERRRFFARTTRPRARWLHLIGAVAPRRAGQVELSPYAAFLRALGRI